MVSFVQAVPFVLFLSFHLTSGCRRGLNPANYIMVTKTCDPTTTHPSVFVANDVTFTDTGYGKVAPSSQCSTCDGGTVNYYPSTSYGFISKGTPDSMGSLTATSCPNMCICDVSGTCYKPTSTASTATFWQFCGNGTCGVYVASTSTDMNYYGGFVSSDGKKMATIATQQDNNTLNYILIPSSVYINAGSVGCKECVDSSCKTTSDNN